MAEKKISYFAKWKGAKVRSGSSYPKLSKALLSGVGAFTAIALLAYLTLDIKFLVLVASLDATAFIVFAAPSIPFAQPRNVIGGHPIAALIGVACSVFSGSSFWVVGLACGAATAMMVLTKTYIRQQEEQRSSRF